jgi:deazaflavin-dependent oxidoreductase (nitroreductase family)
MFMEDNTHYRRPGWFTRNVANRIMIDMTRMGVSVRGSRILETRGRKSGLPRRTPVNLLQLDDHDYLVAPRGETEWVRNVRADDGRITLVLGRKRQNYQGTEVVDDPVKVPLLREYLKRWKSETGVFFDGVGPDSSDEEIAAIANRHPVFQLSQGQA